jgi:outer membrane protein OmpA-like peptidoglycan-associated protein
MTITKTFSLLSVCLAITACSTPPKPPTVDDSQKRPVNVSEAVNLQMCHSELSAAKVVLAEVVAAPRPSPVVIAAPASAGASDAQAAPVVMGTTQSPANGLPNHVFVVRFATGSADFSLGAAQQAQLMEQARAARFIVIRGRTDAATESLDETHLAQRRSEAAYNFLIHAVKLPREAVRVSWQGAGDQADTGHGPLQRQTNRRVEIELYRVKPETEILVG